MADLVNLTIRAPGFLGLNRQSSGEVLPPGWATVSQNLIIDEVGRLAKRKGTKRLTAAQISGATEIGATHVYIDTSGNQITIAAAANKLWRQDGTSWTEITGTITTPTADYWKFQNFNGKCVAWQDGHNPIVLTSTTGTFADIVASSGTVPIGREVLAAYGRLWVLDNDTLYFSDLLDETGWGAGTAGSLLLTRTWPQGVDDPVALAEFNGFLVIMGRRSIVVYQGPTDPASAFSNFEKVEGIDGIGCIARDSVQNIGRDLIFLSAQGLRMLSRVIQEKSMPATDAAPQVRDYLLQQYAGTAEAEVQSAFVQNEALYVLVFENTTVALDLRSRLQDGSFRVTEWDRGFKAPHADEQGNLLIARDGWLLQYEGQLDNVNSDDTGGDNIRIDFEGVWNDFSESAQGVGERLKFLKKVKLYVFGGRGQTIAFKWAVDYSGVFRAVNNPVPISPDAARWGVARYSQDFYSGTFSFHELANTTSLSGRVVKIGISADIGDVPFAVNRIDLFAKVGKFSL